MTQKMIRICLGLFLAVGSLQPPRPPWPAPPLAQMSGQPASL